MWGSCFWFCILSASSRSAARRLLTQLAHTQLPHTQLTHTQLAHTQLAHTQPAHIQLAHTQLAHTQPTHTQLAHTHTQLAHTYNLHTHNLHTYNLLTHNLLTDILLILLTTCSHTTSSHTTYSAFCVAGVALRDIYLHFVCNLHTHTTCTHTTCSHTTCSHTTYSHTSHTHTTWWHGSSLCVAGVALMALGWLWWRAWFPSGAGTPRRFAWQAWHFMTWIVTLRGRRGTWWHGSSLCVAGVALMALGWLWWRAWFPGGAGTPRRFAWHAWHFVTSTFTLCGRRGTSWHGSSRWVAGVALMALGWLWWRACFPGGAGTPRRFAWQAWHFVTSTFTLCGRRGTWWQGSSLCVAGVAVDDMHRYFARQAWHLWHWVGSGGALGSQAALGRRGVLRGRRGTLWHRPSLCVAGVALHDMDRHVA